MEIDSDDLWMFIEDEVLHICENQDPEDVVHAFTSVAWRKLGEYEDKKKRDVMAVYQTMILSDWPEVDPQRTSKMKPVLEAIARVSDKQKRAAIILNHIRALALLISAD
jgi:hypothetical protein